MVKDTDSVKKIRLLIDKMNGRWNGRDLYARWYIRSLTLANFII